MLFFPWYVFYLLAFFPRYEVTELTFLHDFFAKKTKEAGIYLEELGKDNAPFIVITVFLVIAILAGIIGSAFIGIELEQLER